VCDRSLAEIPIDPSRPQVIVVIVALIMRIIAASRMSRIQLRGAQARAIASVCKQPIARSNAPYDFVYIKRPIARLMRSMISSIARSLDAHAIELVLLAFKCALVIVVLTRCLRSFARSIDSIDAMGTLRWGREHDPIRSIDRSIDEARGSQRLTAIRQMVCVR
jgi:hypothetical protein